MSPHAFTRRWASGAIHDDTCSICGLDRDAHTSHEVNRMIPHYEHCGRCGWRRGGLGSWDGKACKCGHTGTPQTTCTTCSYTGLVAGRVCATCNGSGLVPMTTSATAQTSFVSAGIKVGSMDERCANCDFNFGDHYNGRCPRGDA